MSATYDEITTAEIDQDSPITQTLLTKMRDNARAVGFGTDKEWTTPGRAHSTTYQNTTDAAMWVVIQADSAPTRRPVLVATLGDFSDAVSVGFVPVGAADELSASFAVPIGHYYRINGSCIINLWRELIDA